VKETSEERADKTLNALAEVSEEYHEAFSEAQDLPDELVKFFEL